MAIVYPLVLKNTTNLIKNDSGTLPTVNELLLNAGIVLLFIILIFGVNIWTEYRLSVYSSGIRTNARKVIFDKITKVPSDKLNEFGSGKVLATLMNDTGWLRSIERRLVMLSVYFPVTILGSFIVMWTLSRTYFFIAVCALPIALLFFFLSAKVLNKIMPKAASAYDTFFETTREGITGARDIRILGKADERSADSSKQSEVYRRQSSSIDKGINLSASINSVVFSVITAAIIWYGAASAENVNNAAQLVILSTAIQYVNNIWAGFNNLYKWLIGEATRGRESHRRIHRLMDLPEEDTSSGQSNLPTIGGSSLVFNNIGHKFWNGRRTLGKFSLELSNGRSVALAGVAGGGKTTLVKILLRYINPTEGQITVNGLNIADINKLYFRKEVLSFCSSHPNFVPGTIRDNIKLFNPELTDKEIVAALRDIGAGYLVHSASFLDMPISNRFVYSKDTKNIINIVRSVLKPAQFYIFNRCFSHINADIVEKIVKKLKGENKNCLFITFNPTVCKTVDEVCFTTQTGAPVLAPHKTLLAQNADYASFFTEVLSVNEVKT